MENIQRVVTRLTEGLGLSLERVKTVKIEPLKRIPEPPEIYKKWRCLIHGDEDRQDQIEKGRHTLIRESKDDDAMNKVRQYEKTIIGIMNHNIQWAEMALAIGTMEFQGEGIAPVEKIEVRGSDKRKHGESQWMLICGLEFWMDEKQMKQRKIYIPLNPESSRWDLWRYLKKGGKVLLSGSGERGYPPEWDEAGEIEGQRVDDF